MSDEPEQIPADAPSPADRVDAPPPVEPQAEPAGATAAPAAQDPHPEFQVAGAFAGAFLFAKLLRRIGGRK